MWLRIFLLGINSGNLNLPHFPSRRDSFEAHNMDSADPQWRASAVGSEAVLATVGREVSVPLSMLREFLDRNRIQYLVISHSVAYTAQGIAALTHIPGKELAKTVMVMVDGRLSMAVVPASFRVDLYRLKKYLGADSVELATESEFRGRFPDCETGSMPPFGNLYGMDVFAEQALAEDKEIAFNAGSHRELVRMKFADFFELVKPAMIPLAAAKARRHAA
jgi:Ala-tRNA(Pro) deacylase